MFIYPMERCREQTSSAVQHHVVHCLVSGRSARETAPALGRYERGILSLYIPYNMMKIATMIIPDFTDTTLFSTDLQLPHLRSPVPVLQPYSLATRCKTLH
jgi:hypothetical protein